MVLTKDVLQFAKASELDLDRLCSVSLYTGWDAPPWAALVYVDDAVRYGLTKETARLLAEHCTEAPGNVSIHFNGWSWVKGEDHVEG